MSMSYSKLFVGISLPALCTGLASLLLSISANAQAIRPTTQKELKVFDPMTGSSGNIGIRAAAGTLSYTLTLPAARPTANQVLSASAVTGGNVSLTWATPVSGTVTSVGLSTGTTGTDVNVSGSPITSSGTITLNIPTASATNTGKLSFTDWSTFNNKQNAIALTISGTSGAATLVGATLNIPQYQAVLTNPVTGTGTTNYLSKFANAGTLTNSLLFDNGTNVGVGTASPSTTTRFEIRGTGTTSTTTALEVDNINGGPLLVVRDDGNVGIGTTSPRSALEIQEDNSSFFRMVRPAAGTSTITHYGFEGGNGGIGFYDYTNSDYRWWVSPTGDVGIGTTGPKSKLHVDGVISTQAGGYASGPGQWTPQISLLDDRGDRPHHIETLHYVNASYPLGENLWNAINFNVNRGSQGSTDVMTLFGNGNVGIGTTSPGSQLTIVSPWTAANGSGGTPIFSISGNNNANSSFVGGARISPTIGTLGTNNLDLTAVDISPTFFANNSTTISNAYSLRVSATKDGGQTLTNAYSLYVDAPTGATNNYAAYFGGNVGIGTTSPMFRLVVEGAQETGAPFNGNKFATLGLIATNTDVGAGGSIEFGVRSNTTFAAIKGLGHNGSSYTEGDLAFYTRAAISDASMTERMRIMSNGKVSVGDTDPVGRFEVKARSTDVEVLEIEDENESTIFKVTRDGVIRAAKGYTGSATRALHVSSTGTLTTTSSDIRLKTNIEVIPNALQKVMGLRGVTYNWKDGRDTTRVLGMIAQEMLKVAPELVFQNNNGYYGIHYAETTGLLVEAIKEQQKIIDQLKTEQAATGVLIRQLQLDLQAIRKLNTAPKD